MDFTLWKTPPKIFGVVCAFGNHRRQQCQQTKISVVSFFLTTASIPNLESFPFLKYSPKVGPCRLLFLPTIWSNSQQSRVKSWPGSRHWNLECRLSLAPSFNTGEFLIGFVETSKRNFCDL